MNTFNRISIKPMVKMIRTLACVIPLVILSDMSYSGNAGQKMKKAGYKSSSNIDLESAADMAAERFKELATAMASHGFPVSDAMPSMIQDGLSAAKKDGNTSELNRTWKSEFKKIIGDDSAVKQALMKDISAENIKSNWSLDPVKRIQDQLKDNLQEIRLSEHPGASDFFAVEYVRSLMAEGTFIALLDKNYTQDGVKLNSSQLSTQSDTDDFIRDAALLSNKILTVVVDAVVKKDRLIKGYNIKAVDVMPIVDVARKDSIVSTKSLTKSISKVDVAKSISEVDVAKNISEVDVASRRSSDGSQKEVVENELLDDQHIEREKPAKDEDGLIDERKKDTDSTEVDLTKRTELHESGAYNLQHKQSGVEITVCSSDIKRLSANLQPTQYDATQTLASFFNHIFGITDNAESQEENKDHGSQPLVSDQANSNPDPDPDPDPDPAQSMVRALMDTAGDTSIVDLFGSPALSRSSSTDEATE